jgi:hypothetical protein
MFPNIPLISGLFSLLKAHDNQKGVSEHSRRDLTLAGLAILPCSISRIKKWESKVTSLLEPERDLEPKSTTLFVVKVSHPGGPSSPEIQVAGEKLHPTVTGAPEHLGKPTPGSWDPRGYGPAGGSPGRK